MQRNHRPLWRRMVGFNLLTGIMFGIAGFYLGRWLGRRIDATSLAFFASTGRDDVALMLGYLLFVVGFLVGVGFGSYLVGIGVFLFIGGVYMLSTELISVPTALIFSPLPTSVLVAPQPTLASLRGEPAAINFWASWCDPCREEAPALERLSRSLDGRAQVVGVNWTDSLGGARAWVDEYHWTFPNLHDPDGAAGSDYGLRGLPTTFIIDSHGRIADVLLGPQSETGLREALDSAG